MDYKKIGFFPNIDFNFLNMIKSHEVKEIYISLCVFKALKGVKVNTRKYLKECAIYFIDQKLQDKDILRLTGISRSTLYRIKRNKERQR